MLPVIAVGLFGVCRTEYQGTSNLRKPIGEPTTDVVLAIKYVSERVSLASPVLIQKIHSGRNQESLLFTPIPQATDSPIGREKQWRVEVQLPIEGDDRSRIIEYGIRPLKDSEEKAQVERLSRAAIVASRHMEEEGWLTLPVILGVRESGGAYSVFYERHPPVWGGHTLVQVSGDFTQVRIIGGR